MKILKPKDIAIHIKIPPGKVSVMAKDIENAQIHQFSKTPLGSFLFKENEVGMLKEYNELFSFFKRKKEALQMLAAQLDERRTSQKPEWLRLLRNTKWV